jgi:glyoxalase family protein
MDKLINGIHHITALVDEPKKNIDFYTGILGLRLVKRIVNSDAPDIYHFYFESGTSTSGTLLTFWPHCYTQNGRSGHGMVSTILFSVSLSSFRYWEKRLKKFHVNTTEFKERFEDELVFYFKDNDGLGLGLVFNDKDSRPGFTDGHIPIEYSIKGFYSAEIRVADYARTAALLTEQLDHKLIAEKENRFRFATSDKTGNYLDLLYSPDPICGLGRCGTVHHIAFSTDSEEIQTLARNKMLKKMLHPTPVIDRKYFKSVYFREPGGVLFEITTIPPAFLFDQNVENLREELEPPPKYEQPRDEIAKILQPFTV